MKTTKELSKPTKCCTCRKIIKPDKKLKVILAHVVGKKILCDGCVLELADIIYHQFDGRFGKHICKKLDKYYRV